MGPISSRHYNDIWTGGSGRQTTEYLYDGGQVIAEYDGNDTLLRMFIYGPGIDEPICMIDVANNDKVYYYYFDGLGFVIALSDSSGNVVERYSYDVFGEPTIWDVNAQDIVESSTSAIPICSQGRKYANSRNLGAKTVS